MIFLEDFNLFGQLNMETDSIFTWPSISEN